MSISVSRKRNYRPHYHALHGARVLLQLSAEKPDGCYYQWMGSLLLSAFAFEGYLNLLGRVFFPSWESFERGLSWQNKVKLIGDRVDCPVDNGRQPYQTVKLLFQFRDNIAHPKPTELTETQKDVENFRELLISKGTLKSEEEKFCTGENATLCLDRVEEMMKVLYDKAKAKYEVEHPFRKGESCLFAPHVSSIQLDSAHSN